MMNCLVRPMDYKINYYLRLISLASIIIMIDQFSKSQLIGMLEANHYASIPINSFFNLVMVWNKGVSFGLFSSGNTRIYLIIMAFFVVGTLLIWYRKRQSKPLLISLSLIVGGAIGNVIDRFRYGAVADFFDFHLNGMHYPAFNFADMSIVCGVGLLCLIEFKKS
jgi:signal peptidase II